MSRPAWSLKPGVTKKPEANSAFNRRRRRRRRARRRVGRVHPRAKRRPRHDLRSVASARETVRRRHHRPRAGVGRGGDWRARSVASLDIVARDSSTRAPADRPWCRSTHSMIRRLTVAELSRRRQPLGRRCASNRRARRRQPRHVRRGAAGGRLPARARRCSAVRVADVALDAGGTRLETAAGMVRAGFLIGADGANSLVRRRLARPFRRDELSIATGYFAHGITSDEIVIELIDDPPGYIWSFPRPDASGDRHLRAGRCGIDSRDLARENRGMDPRGRGSPTAPGSNRTRGRFRRSARQPPRGSSWPGHDWCVVGDAAGLVDPITREGIYFALASGAWAADAAIAGDARAVRGACAIGSPARARSRGAAQGGVLPAGLHAPAGSCAPAQRRRS